MSVRLSPCINEQEIEDRDLSKDMLSIWKETFFENSSFPKNIYLTRKRIYALTAILENLFDVNLMRWKNYCSVVRKTLFITCRKENHFSLDWAINFDNASTIPQSYVSSSLKGL